LKSVQVFTDGACKGNPGPGGWGAVLRFGTNEREIFGGEPSTTNNRMELMAAIEALKVITEPCQVALTTDSVYVKDGVTKWMANWKRNGWKTAAKKPVKNQDLWQALDAEVQRHDGRWHGEKGHSEPQKNGRAGALPNLGITTRGEGI